MALPPYAYVPGHWPHPTRDPAGHAYGGAAAEGEPSDAPFDPENWARDAAWRRAVELFEHGYYWEAHEVWESQWLSVAEGTPERELLGGLIKLAAAGIKIRQGKLGALHSLAAKAGAQFSLARRLAGAEQLAGIAFVDLRALVDGSLAMESLEATGGERVRVVFDRPLLRSETRPASWAPVPPG